VTWIAFHTWIGAPAGAPGSVRSTLIERLAWYGAVPALLATTPES
jgi:hypothetical protein